MNPVSGRQNFVVGDFDWVIAPSASNTFIGFSFASSKAVLEKILVHGLSPGALLLEVFKPG
jgi:hypothetical protein